MAKPLTKEEVESYLGSVDLRGPLEEALNVAVSNQASVPVAFLSGHFAAKKAAMDIGIIPQMVGPCDGLLPQPVEGARGQADRRTCLEGDAVFDGQRVAASHGHVSAIVMHGGDNLALHRLINAHALQRRERRALRVVAVAFALNRCCSSSIFFVVVIVVVNFDDGGAFLAVDVAKRRRLVRMRRGLFAQYDERFYLSREEHRPERRSAGRAARGEARRMGGSRHRRRVARCRESPRVGIIVVLK